MNPASARTFAAACLGAAVAPLDTMVNPAFPAISADFSLEVAQIQWVPIAYLLAYGSLALISGRLGDLYGYRRICLLGLAVSASAFAACAVAPTYAWFLAARVLQGVGIALTLGGAPPLAMAAYPESQRTAVLARYSAVLALVLALSPAAGGMLIEAFGWRAVYAVRVPIALAALALLARVPEAQRHPHAQGFDGAGAALLMFWLTAFVLALALPAAIGWPLALLAAAGLAMFVVHEARSAAPIVRPSLFLDARFALFNAASVGVHFVGFSMFLLGPYFFVRVAGLSTLAAGVLLSFGPAGAALGSALAERLVRRFGTGRVAFASSSLVAVTVGAAAAWNAQSAVIGIGLAPLRPGRRHRPVYGRLHRLRGGGAARRRTGRGGEPRQSHAHAGRSRRVQPALGALPHHGSGCRRRGRRRARGVPRRLPRQRRLRSGGAGPVPRRHARAPEAVDREVEGASHLFT